MDKRHFDGLGQDGGNYRVLAMELPKFCAKPSTWMVNQYG